MKPSTVNLLNNKRILANFVYYIDDFWTGMLEIFRQSW